MKARVVDVNGGIFLEGDGIFIKNESDVLDLISLCGEFGAEKILLHRDALSEEFFDLKTGLAGHFLQKLANYRIRLAIIDPSGACLTGRFGELAAEGNQGGHFGVFPDRDEAARHLND